MNLDVWEYDQRTGRAVLINADLILISEFKALLEPERNKCKDDPTGLKHLRADREFTYIYLAISWKSPYANYAEQERHQAALQDGGITEQEWNDSTFRAACRKYRALQESNRYVRLLESAQLVTDKIIDYFNNIDIEERDEQTGKYVFGITYSIQQREKGNVLTNLKYSAYEVRYWIYSTVQSLKLLVTRQLSVNDLNGPVGIVKNMGDTYQKSVTTDGIGYAFLNMLNWAILLAANLGVMNLLPFPALDGGRLVFLVVEAIRRKKANQKVEGVINMIGLGLLFLLMFFVMFNDIRKLL